jgi:hypothetical protein
VRGHGRESLGHRAWADAARLAPALLEQFDGVVGDVQGMVWTREEVAAGVRKEGRRFLEHPGAGAPGPAAA